MSEIRFEITSWDVLAPGADDPLFGEHDGDGPALTRTRLTKRYSGELEGESVVEMQASGEVGYVATERVSGTLGGRRGTFVLQHGATFDADGTPRRFGWVAKDSGSGELTGLSGEAHVAHELLSLDWRLPA
ncbi:MAG TPA: DUF3224 domain-containing protein [Conexibacter sp.]|nr:DUF3224 domain-containing protein [Conexibacter sp.]